MKTGHESSLKVKSNQKPNKYYKNLKLKLNWEKGKDDNQAYYGAQSNITNVLCASDTEPNPNPTYQKRQRAKRKKDNYSIC